MSKAILHLDLHDVAHTGSAIDTALQRLIDEAMQKRVKKAEIIPGKGTGQLMKRVKKFLAQKPIKATYKRLEVDVHNHGRIFVHFH